MGVFLQRHSYSRGRGNPFKIGLCHFGHCSSTYMNCMEVEYSRRKTNGPVTCSKMGIPHLVGSLLYGGGDTSRALASMGQAGDVFYGSSVGDSLQQGTSGVTTVMASHLMGFIRYGLVH